MKASTKSRKRRVSKELERALRDVEKHGTVPIEKVIPAAMLRKSRLKHNLPLKFVNATPKEAREIEESIKRSHKKGSSVSVKELLKKHRIG